MFKHGKYVQVEAFLGRIFLILLSIGFALWGAEHAYRALRKSRADWNELSPLTQAIHQPKPYVMFSAKPSSSINKLGYLGPIPVLPKPEGEYRVFMLGGSALFDGKPGIDRDLESLFRAAGQKGVTVYNFGIVSSVSRQELVRILLEVGTYSPDLIVSYSGYNDTYDTGWDPRINYSHRQILYDSLALAENAADFRLLPLLGLSSQIVRDFFPKQLFKLLIAEIIPPNMPPRSQLRPLIAAAYIQNLRLSGMLSRDFGADFVSFYQPTAWFKTAWIGKELQLEPGLRQTASEIRASVRAEASKYSNELEFHDLSDLFRDETREVFSDAVHYGPAWAREQVAAHLFTLLSPRVARRIKERQGGQEVAKSIDHLVPEDLFEVY